MKADSKARKRKRGSEKTQASSAANAERDEKVALIRSILLSRGMEASIVDWLVETPEAVTYARVSATADDAATSALVDKLVSFRDEAQKRRTELTEVIKRRLVKSERATLKESWTIHTVKVAIPSDYPGGLCVNVQARSSPEPEGMLVTSFNPARGRLTSPSSPSSSLSSSTGMGPGPLEATGKVFCGDVITRVDRHAGGWQAVMRGLQIVQHAAYKPPPGISPVTSQPGPLRGIGTGRCMMLGRGMVPPNVIMGKGMMPRNMMMMGKGMMPPTMAAVMMGKGMLGKAMMPMMMPAAKRQKVDASAPPPAPPAAAAAETPIANVGTMTEVSLTVRRFKAAPAADVAAAEARALEPVRLGKALASPLVEKFARVTHSVNPDIWLFDPATVASEILLPMERFSEVRNILETTLQPHGLDLALVVGSGAEEDKVRVVPHAMSGPGNEAYQNLSKFAGMQLFGLCSVENAVAKFIKHGEIGRGRNKTAINKPQQLARAIATEAKARGF